MFNSYRLAALLLTASCLGAQQFQPAVTDGKLRVLVFGAHPDDCELSAGGLAAKYAKLGHHVKFVALTTGDNGHPSMGGGALATRRRAEAAEAGRRLGVEAYDVLENHSGELMPTLEMRRVVVRKIREWRADVVLLPRLWDYHPITVLPVNWFRTRLTLSRFRSSRRIPRRGSKIRCSCSWETGSRGRIRRVAGVLPEQASGPPFSRQSI